MKRLVFLIPIAVVVVLGGFFFAELRKNAERLRDGQIDVLPSPLIGKPAPDFVLAPFNGATPGFTRADLAAGHVTIVNFWASWCTPCRVEHPLLLALAKRRDFALYGVVYKDTKQQAESYLDELGNPFARLVDDPKGRASIDWGVTAAPETFVVDGKGIIRARYAGALTEDVLARIIFPAAGLAPGL